MDGLRYIDFHSDTLTELQEGESLRRNSRSVTLAELRAAQVWVQCFSMFVPTGLFGADSIGRVLPEAKPDSKERMLLKEDREKAIADECERIYGVYERTLLENRDVLRGIYHYEDVERCRDDKKTGILLTIEDGGVLFGSRKRLKEMYEKGVRLITLTWNHENEIGYPNTDSPKLMQRGLKSTGQELVEYMNELHILVDVSHLSDGGFYDVAKLMKRAGRAFVASHSNARAVTGHPRNLTDDMIRVLAECGGVMGLNLAPHFLNETQQKDGESRIADMVKHILHIRNVGGAEVLAIGSDFDGIEGKLEISKPTEFEKLQQALMKAGIPSSDIEKLWNKNAVRILKQLG